MPMFSHLCRAVAVLGLVYSLFILFIAYQRYGLLDPAVAISEGDRNMRHGLQTLLGSIVLGTLAEISFALRRRNDG